MNTFILDNMVDVTGTLATAHSPQAGGPIVSVQGNDTAQITDQNRMRGQSVSGSAFTYSLNPAGHNWSVNFSIFVASNENGFGIICSGYALTYTISNAGWRLAGGNLPGPLRFDQNLNVGQRYKGTITSSGGVVSVTIDGSTIFSESDSAAPALSPPGFEFFGQDTDSTGYQLESFAASSIVPALVDLDGSFVCDGGGSLFVASDNEFYLLGLIDRVTGAYVRGATVAAQVTTLDGTPVGSPVTLSFVSGSITVPLPNAQTRTSADGNYIGQLPASTPLVDGTTYYVKTTATSGSNQRVFRGSYSGAYSTN